MNLSLKHMIISFVAALIVLSVIMSAICVSVFRSRVNEHLTEGEGIATEGLPERSTVYPFSETSVYYVERDGSPAYAALVCVSEAERVVTVTPFASTLPVPFQGSIYFVSTICEAEGNEALCDVASALTGMAVNMLVDAEEQGVTTADSLEAFAENMRTFLAKRYEDYKMETLPVVIDKDGVADSNKTIQTFFKVESN